MTDIIPKSIIKFCRFSLRIDEVLLGTHYIVIDEESLLTVKLNSRIHAFYFFTKEASK